MSQLTLTPELRTAAMNCVWWKTPADAILDVADITARILTYGGNGDIEALLEQLDQDALREALDNAPPNVFNGPSWAFWNLKAGRDEPPPLQLRKTVYPLDHLHRYFDDPFPFKKRAGSMQEQT